MVHVGDTPNISAVEWLSAKEVLGGEASDFTPWLVKPASIQILGAALKLEELTPVTAELNVLGKRLDILATALDENGDEVPVCIENQYGMSDASHLGRLIAYLAHQGKGRAVWVVEQAHDAYVAGVRFLNRTSSDDVGYYLVEVRFTHGAAGSYQVHFEVLAAPIAWERGTKGTGGIKPLNEPKVAYLAAIHEAVRPALLGAGFPNMNTHARGAYLWITWPKTLWFRRFAPRLDIRVTQNAVTVAVYVWTFPTREANTIAMGFLEERYGDAVAERVQDGATIGWAAAGTGQREAVRIALAGAGYDGGDPQEAATWASKVVLMWLDLLRDDPISDLEQRVQAALPGQDVGPTVEPEDDPA
jgi:hypothetical protein